MNEVRNPSTETRYVSGVGCGDMIQKGSKCPNCGRDS